MPFIVLDSPYDDVWEKNPSLELVSEFKKLKDTEGIDRAGSILKAIYYIWDPKSNIRDSGLSDDKLLEDVNTMILGDKDFDWTSYESIKNFYIENNISRMERLLLRYEKEISDLNQMLEEWPWSKTDVKARSEAVKAYKSLFDEYIEVAAKVKVESEEAMELLGGYQKSMIESFG